DLVVQDRARVVELLRLGHAQHETDAATIEEREIRHLEQEPHAERIAVEPHGARNVAHANGDLPDAVEDNLVRRERAHARLRERNTEERSAPPRSGLSLAMLTIMSYAGATRKSES